jgi:hypothetical protein
MLLSWMGGNMGVERIWSGDSVVWFSTAGGFVPGFAVNPQIAVGCGGTVLQAAISLIIFGLSLSRRVLARAARLEQAAQS